MSGKTLTKMNMEVRTNEKVTVRKETLEGHEHLVVPATIMVEGVHAGSGGPVFYPKEELEKTTFLWNGVVVPVGHPTDEEGHPVPANDPSHINERAVGRFFNASFKNDRIVGEMWLNEATLTEKFPDVKTKIQNGEDIEVSASLYTMFCDEVPGVWNNESHKGTVSGYIPDHVAIMNGQKGACGFEDGCGIRNNSGKVKREFTYIKVDNKEMNMERKEVVEKIVANTAFLKDMKLEADPLKTLTEMPEPAFTIVQNAFARITGCDCQKKEDEKLVTNEKKEEAKPVISEKKDEKKPEPTLEQYINSAPAELRDVLNQSVRMHKGKKTELVNALLTNKRNKFTKSQLEGKSMDELEILAELAQVEPNMEGRSFTTSSTLKTNERRADGSGVPDCPEVSWKD